VTVTSTGVLRAHPGDEGMLLLSAFDEGRVLASIEIVALDLDGATELTGAEDPGEWSEGLSALDSNRIHVRHDRANVPYVATAEVTCAAAGEVRAGRLNYGLEWSYELPDRARMLDPDGEYWPFECVD
jgi:hypothetical protein